MPRKEILEDFLSSPAEERIKKFKGKKKHQDLILNLNHKTFSKSSNCDFMIEKALSLNCEFLDKIIQRFDSFLV